MSIYTGKQSCLSFPLLNIFVVLKKACEWTSAPKITQLITYLRDYFWPPKNKSLNSTALTERDKEMKLRTRVLCRTVLLGSVSGR